MSRAKSVGFAIVERLEEIGELKGKVIFFRRSDVESEFNRRMGRAKGKAVIVRLLEEPNLTPGHTAVTRGAKYTVALFTSPTLTAKDAKDADALMKEIDEKLQGWWPEDVPSNRATWLSCGDRTYPEDPDFDIATMSVTFPQPT